MVQKGLQQNYFSYENSNWNHSDMRSYEFSLNICHYSKRVRTCPPATSCAREQDATTAPARHMWETGSLNWAQFILQWFISFPEFAEFSEFLFHLGKTPLSEVTLKWHTTDDIFIYWWTKQIIRAFRCHRPRPWRLQRGRPHHLMHQCHDQWRWTVRDRHPQSPASGLFPAPPW